jgi:hypothetical protein
MGLLQASATLLAAPSGRYAAPPDAVLAALQLEVAVNEALGAAVRVEGDAPWTVAGLDAYYQAGLRLSGAIKDQALWKEVEAIIEAGHETPEALVAAIEALPRFKEIDPEAYAAFKAAALAKPTAAPSVVADPDVVRFIEDQHIRFSTRACHPSVHEARGPFLELLDACVNPDQRACIMQLAREEQLDICALREQLSTMPALQAADGSGHGPDLSRFLAATREVAEKYATR